MSEDDPMVSAVEQWFMENPPLTLAAWQARATAAEAREAKLRAALRYYANHDNYHDGILVRSAVGTDRGKLARAALETDNG